MENRQISLDDRPDKKGIRILIVIFGVLCLFTSGWWALYMLKVPENNAFWLATIFLFLFGLYQIYSGLGYARRYMNFTGKKCTVRQNSLLPGKTFSAHELTKIEIGPSDIRIIFREGKTFKIKLGLKYPDLGENIKENLIEYASENKIEIFYNNKPL